MVTKQIKKVLLVLISALVVAVLFFPIVSQAEEEGEEELPDGIIKIVTAYMDEAGNMYYAKQGTGFVIGINSSSNDNAKKYVISDYGIVEGEATYVEAIRKRYGLEPNVKLTICYYAVGNMGVLSELKINSYSNETRYVILDPSGPLADKSCLKLGDGSGVKENTRVHVEGYTGSRSIVTDTSVEQRGIVEYDTVITGVSEQEYYNDAITYFQVGETVDEGMAGAPVIDENQCVVGMFIMNNGKLQAMSVDNIRVILDSLAINYMVAEDNAAYDVPTEAQRHELKTLITENKEYISHIKRNRYTAETWEALYNAIATADSVYMSNKSTAKQYDDSILALTKARKKLKTKVHKFIVINIVVAVAVLVFLYILFRVLKTRKRVHRDIDKINKMSVRG